MAVKIIALGGPIASGKSSVTKLLEENLHAIKKSMGQLVREEAEKLRRSGFYREELQDVGQITREREGDDYFARVACEKIKKEVEEGKIPEDSLVIIDGVRTPGELEYLHSQGIFVLGITADQEVRMERVDLRARPGDNITEIREQDTRELVDWHGNEMLAGCDAVIDTTFLTPDERSNELQRILRERLAIDLPLSPEGQVSGKENKI